MTTDNPSDQVDFYNTSGTKNQDLDAHNLYNTVTNENTGRAKRQASVEMLEQIEESASPIKGNAEKAQAVTTKPKKNKAKRI